MNFNLVEATQMLVTHGSRAYGMNTSTSDVDVKGFMLVPLASRFDIFDRVEQVDKPAGVMDVFLPYMTKEEQEVAAAEKIEGVVYEFGKFLNLLLGFNPSMMDVIFCRDQEVRICKPMAERLRENRDMFLSRKAVTSYVAYAEGQLKRAQTHRGWLLSPPKAPPTREEFGLANTKIMTKDRVGAAERLIAIMENDGLTREEAVIELGMSDVMEMLSKENAYRAAKKNWDSYVEWSKHRNRERADGEARVGYDLKNASHVVRLALMGKEIVMTGKVNVWREDADFILSVRRGEWSYDQWTEWFYAIKKEIQAFDMKLCPLPEEPDYDGVRAFFAEEMGRYYGVDFLKAG